MGAIIMDDVIIEDNCIAAGAIVTKNTFIPSYSVLLVFLLKIKNLSEEQFQKKFWI